MNGEDDDGDLHVVAGNNPALLIQDGDFGTLPQEWAHLETSRPLFKRMIPSVGRLEMGVRTSVGTAFVAGVGILMTNRHVIENFARPVGDEWEFNPGVTSVRVDFGGEHDRTTASELPVEAIIGVDAQYDLALLRIPAETDFIVKALPLQRDEPDSIVGRELVAIGYPDRDNAIPDDVLQRTFGNIFGVKRLQPGKITALRSHNGVSVFSHDCSTTGGSSGSCMIDVASGKVLALHFGGGGTVNLTVPLWKVAHRPFLKSLNWR
ncbi:MAG TPA: serine protease [Thermoanaerobaculia bacterium]